MVVDLREADEPLDAIPKELRALLQSKQVIKIGSEVLDDLRQLYEDKEDDTRFEPWIDVSEVTSILQAAGVFNIKAERDGLGWAGVGLWGQAYYYKPCSIKEYRKKVTNGAEVPEICNPDGKWPKWRSLFALYRWSKRLTKGQIAYLRNDGLVPFAVLMRLLLHIFNGMVEDMRMPLSAELIRTHLEGYIGRVTGARASRMRGQQQARARRRDRQPIAKRPFRPAGESDSEQEETPTKVLMTETERAVSSILNQYTQAARGNMRIDTPTTQQILQEGEAHTREVGETCQSKASTSTTHSYLQTRVDSALKRQLAEEEEDLLGGALDYSGRTEDLDKELEFTPLPGLLSPISEDMQGKESTPYPRIITGGKVTTVSPSESGKAASMPTISTPKSGMAASMRTPLPEEERISIHSMQTVRHEVLPTLDKHNKRQNEDEVKYREKESENNHEGTSQNEDRTLIWSADAMDMHFRFRFQCGRCGKDRHDGQECERRYVCGYCSQRHSTEVCLSLHRICDHCRLRGHLDCRNERQSDADRAKRFERYASRGMFTSLRFSKPEWGLYPLRGVRGVLEREDFDYAELVKNLSAPLETRDMLERRINDSRERKGRTTNDPIGEKAGQKRKQHAEESRQQREKRSKPGITRADLMEGIEIMCNSPLDKEQSGKAASMPRHKDSHVEGKVKELHLIGQNDEINRSVLDRARPSGYVERSREDRERERHRARQGDTQRGEKEKHIRNLRDQLNEQHKTDLRERLKKREVRNTTFCKPPPLLPPPLVCIEDTPVRPKRENTPTHEESFENVENEVRNCISTPQRRSEYYYTDPNGDRHLDYGTEDEKKRTLAKMDKADREFKDRKKRLENKRKEVDYEYHEQDKKLRDEMRECEQILVDMKTEYDKKQEQRRQELKELLDRHQKVSSGERGIIKRLEEKQAARQYERNAIERQRMRKKADIDKELRMRWIPPDGEGRGESY